MRDGHETARPQTPYAERFDELFDNARPGVLSGRHFRDSPPIDGGRYGMSVVLLPDQTTADRLAQTTAEVLRLTGPGHWPTGSAATAHFTVRCLEPYRGERAADDPAARRGAAALRRAALRCAPIRLRLRGLTLSSSGVMVCAHPVDAAADAFMTAVAEELGDDGWFERDFHRTIWYATVVHFAADLADPAGLVEWLAERRQLDLGEVSFDTAHLIRWTFDGRQPVHTTFERTALAGPAGRAAG